MSIGVQNWGQNCTPNNTWFLASENCGASSWPRRSPIDVATIYSQVGEQAHGLRAGCFHGKARRAQELKRRYKRPVNLMRNAFSRRQLPAIDTKALTDRDAVTAYNAVSTMVRNPIAMVMRPMAPCNEVLAAVNQRAETAIGTAIAVESTPIPIIEPIPNSAT